VGLASAGDASNAAVPTLARIRFILIIDLLHDFHRCPIRQIKKHSMPHKTVEHHKNLRRVYQFDAVHGAQRDLPNILDL
jgi:hypothetical protein